MKYPRPSLELACLMMITAGCASTHPGEMASPVTAGSGPRLKVSAETQENASDDYTRLVTFTIENLEDDFVRTSYAELKLDSVSAGLPKVIVGKDLVSWAQAFEAEEKKSRHNAKVAQTGMMLGGLLLGGIGSATRSGALTGVGAGVALTGAGWSLTDAITNAVRNAKNPAKVPDEHVLAGVNIPPGKFVRRWAVIQHRKSSPPHTGTLTFVIEGGERVSFRARWE